MRVRQVGALVIAVGGMMVMVPACAGEQRGPRQSHNPAPQSPCEKKCDEAQEKAAEKCSEITAEKEREKCQTDAYEQDKGRRQKCWEGCNEANGQCKKKCK